MEMTLAELAELVGGTLTGNGSLRVTNVRRLALAGPTEVTFATDASHQNALAASSACAAIVTKKIDGTGKPCIVVDDVNQAVTQAVLQFRPRRKTASSGISPQAILGENVRLGENVEIQAGAFVGDDVILGDNVVVHSGARVLSGCQIGANTTLFPNAVLYEETIIGQRCLIHAGAMIGAYGFGYEEIDGRHVLSQQLGYVEINDDVEVGAATTIDRGTFGPTIIGEGTKIDNLVMIAHNCQIGRHNLICSQVGIAGSTTTGDYVVMAGQVGVRDHVHIGERAILGSKSGIPNDVPEGEVMLGAPATPLRQQKLQLAAIAKLPEMRKKFRTLQKQVQTLVESQEAASASSRNEKAA